MGDVLATVREYSDLQAAMRARADEINISRMAIDEALGLTRGHAGKILASYPMRALGRTTMGPMLWALGLKLLVVVDEEAMADPRFADARGARVAWKARVGARMRQPLEHDLANQPGIKALRRKVLGKHMSKLGKAGGRKSGLTRKSVVPASTRRRWARHAAKVRWDRERAKATAEHHATAPLRHPAKGARGS